MRHRLISYACLWLHLFILSFSFLSCSSSGNRFRLEGHFRNLNQGEFYIYNLETGTKDTIGVSDGRFTYEIVVDEPATLSLLFPNYSELPIFAEPGAKVKMEGDVSHLRETDISGTDDNEAMTKFRTDTNDMIPPEVQKRAAQFIKEHPASPVSTYLLKRFFIFNTEPDYATAYDLCKAMQKARPDNVQLAQLFNHLKTLRNNKSEGPLPAFSAIDTRGDTITDSQLTAQVNVIYVWSMSNYDSQSALRQLGQLQKDHTADSLKIITISLDASPDEGKSMLERESIDWPNICDGLMWQSPVIAQLGIATLPACIVTDSSCNIVARNLKTNDLKEKIEALLKE